MNWEPAVFSVDPYGVRFLFRAKIWNSDAVNEVRERFDEILSASEQGGWQKIVGKIGGEVFAVFLHENPQEIKRVARLRNLIERENSSLVALLADGTAKARILGKSMDCGLVVEIPQEPAGFLWGNVADSIARHEKYRGDLDEILVWMLAGGSKVLARNWEQRFAGELARGNFSGNKLGETLVAKILEWKIRGRAVRAIENAAPRLEKILENFSVEKLQKKLTQLLGNARFGLEFSLGGVDATRAVEQNGNLLFRDVTGARWQPRGWDAVGGEFRDFLRAVPEGEKEFAGWQSKFWVWVEKMRENPEMEVLIFVQMILLMAEFSWRAEFGETPEIRQKKLENFRNFFQEFFWSSR